tara:strand:+ start:963 stop:1136 length:174 start_codon:yes stop_codon:yes gene_type:complete
MTQTKSFLSEKFAKFAEEVVKVRARDEKGGFVADNPSTPENEAWVKKSAKNKPKDNK